MATDTAHPARHDPTRNLWQWPTFLLGLVVFAAAWRGLVPIGPVDPATEFSRDLTSLRRLAEASNPDTITAQMLADKIAASANLYPDQAPLIHFVLGSWYVRKAEFNGEPEAAKVDWRQAAQHLEQIGTDQLTNPTADGPRLVFRAAKAHAAIGFPSETPPSRIDVVVRVLNRIPQDEPIGELNRLLAELYSRQTLPDPDKAKDALRRYLADAGLETPESNLARAKLRLAELHLEQHEVEDARRWLGQIGPKAPPDVLVPAYSQLAGLHMAENLWDKAAEEWGQVRKTIADTPSLKASASNVLAAYQLGVCQLMLKKTDEAARLFEEVSRAGGPEGFAAIVKLADITLKKADPPAHQSAAAALAEAAKNLPPPANYANRFVSLNELRATFEQCIQVLENDGLFEPALASAAAFGRIAVAGREREKRAEVLAKWGDAYQKAGWDARPKYGAAGDEYLALAKDDVAPASAKAGLLQRAATLYRKAENPAAVLEALGRLVKLPEIGNDILGTAWVDMAEVLLATRQPDEALKAFQQAMLTAGPAAMAARYKLARLLLDVRDPKKAPFGMELLKQIANAEVVMPAEREFFEKAQVELGQEALRGGQYQEAENRFRKQLGCNPNGPEAGLGKFLLGVCILQQTARPLDAKDDKAELAERREQALALFKELVKEADDKKAANGGLSERDSWLRTQASLRILQAYQQMGKPGDVITCAAAVRLENKGRVEELIALSMMYHAHKQSNRPELALQVLDEMKKVFEELPESVYHDGKGEYSRAYWERVWFNPPDEPMPPAGSPAPSGPAPAGTNPISANPSGGMLPVPVPTLPAPLPGLPMPAPLPSAAQPVSGPSGFVTPTGGTAPAEPAPILLPRKP